VSEREHTEGQRAGARHSAPGGAVELRWTTAPAELEAALALRAAVFVCEQRVPREEELDGRDGDALHLIALARGSAEVVGTLRLLLEGEAAKIGRVAVARGHRRRGIAASMLELALEQARASGASRARLAAQIEALELYRRAGFAVESEPFQEAGIEHVWMGRAL